MDGGQDGAQAQGKEQQGQQGDPQADDEEIRAALAERDEKIAELEAQIDDVSKTLFDEYNKRIGNCDASTSRSPPR